MSDIVERIEDALGQDTFWDTDAPPLLTDAVAEIKRLRNERCWISLSEREPEEYATVMVFHKGEVYCGELRHPNGEEGWDDSWWMLFKYQFPQQNWCDMAFVDAGDRWMPLPEPPEPT